MVRYKTPKDLENYITVKEEGLVYHLHKNRHEPLYRDNEYIYFRRTKELEDFLLNIAKKLKEGEIFG